MIKIRNIKILLSVLLLIVIDQYIKIYISNNLINQKIDFFNNIIGFKPHKNIDYSWFNSLGNFKIGLLPHIVFNIIVLFISIIIFDFIRQKYKHDRIINWLFIFLFAGTICSLIDKVFWGGSLDYIYLKNLFIFDLKDIYISAFQATLILCLIFNYKGFRKINEKLLYNDLKLYIKAKYLKKYILLDFEEFSKKSPLEEKLDSIVYRILKENMYGFKELAK